MSGTVVVVVVSSQDGDGEVSWNCQSVNVGCVHNDGCLYSAGNPAGQ